MKRFIVKWEIDIEAESYRDAAKQADEIMRDPGSSAKVFYVRGEDDSYTEGEMIDLWDDEDDPDC